MVFPYLVKWAYGRSSRLVTIHFIRQTDSQEHNRYVCIQLSKPRQHYPSISPLLITVLADDSRFLNFPRGGLPSSKPNLRDGESVVSDHQLRPLSAAYRVTFLPSDISVMCPIQFDGRSDM